MLGNEHQHFNIRTFNREGCNDLRKFATDVNIILVNISDILLVLLNFCHHPLFLQIRDKLKGEIDHLLAQYLATISPHIGKYMAQYFLFLIY